jgi:hypothetical protein
MEMLEFKIGDRVAFGSDRMHTVEGMLTRYNKKTVTVIADDGRRWTVSPGLLRKAPNAKPHEKNVTPNPTALRNANPDKA